jgi:acetolactate synthase I/II/III large subunit
MRTSDKIFEIIKQYVDTIFFLPGGGAMYLVDAMSKSGLTYITALHEQGAGFMACGYAQLRKGLGVCLVTTGPGATNAITPCTAAWMDSIPVLFISGQIMTKDMIGDSGLRSRGGQEVDIISVVKPITKLAITPMSSKSAIKSTEVMIQRCLEGRPGPCWLDVPLNIQGEEI